MPFCKLSKFPSTPTMFSIVVSPLRNVSLTHYYLHTTFTYHIPFKFLNPTRWLHKDSKSLVLPKEIRRRNGISLLQPYLINHYLIGKQFTWTKRFPIQIQVFLHFVQTSLYPNLPNIYNPRKQNQLNPTFSQNRPLGLSIISLPPLPRIVYHII